MLADTAGEEDGVNSVHLGGVGSDVLDHLECQHLEYKLGLAVAVVGELVQLTGVGCLLGDSEETALLVHDVVHLIRSEILLLHHVEDGVCVHVAAAGSHDQTLKRSETHRGVD